MLSTENIVSDIFQGCFVVLCTLFAFAGLVWLREQIVHGGNPEWLARENGAAPGLGEDGAPPRLLDNIPEEEEAGDAPANGRVPGKYNMYRRSPLYLFIYTN